MLDTLERVPPRAVYDLIPKPFRIKFILAIVFRVLTNFLDMAALAGVAVLALAISSVADGKSTGYVRVPVIGNVSLSASTTALIAFVVLLLFLSKSAISIWFISWIGNLAAKCEAVVGRNLLISYFGQSIGNRNPVTNSEISGIFLMSLTSLLSGSVTAFVSICAEGTLVLLIVSAFLLVNPIATLFLCLYFSLILVALNWVSASAIKRVTRTTYDVSLETVAAASNLFSVEKELYTLGLAETWIDKVIQLRSRYAKLAVEMARNNGLPRYVVESSLVLGIFLFIGSILIFSDLPTQALTLGVFLTGGFRFVASVLPLQAAINVWRQALVNGKPAFELLKAGQKKLLLGRATQDAFSGSEGVSIRVDSLQIESPESGIPLIEQVSFTVPAGAKVAITGPSGAGKTTLLNAILGLHVPTGGIITLDSMSVEDFHTNTKGQVAYVPQTPKLISGSVLENITLRLEPQGVDVERVRSLLRDLDILRQIDALEHGLATKISPDVKLFSGGEIQRIGLARALYWEPRLLLLDEVTSALDARTEELVMRTIDSHRGRATILMVSHREAPIANSDMRIHLKSGRLG